MNGINYIILMEKVAMFFYLLVLVALPVLIVWLNNRKKINEAKLRTQIVLAAIEKNAETDVEDLLRKMAPQKKLLKEKLLAKLLWGSIPTLLGLGFVVIALCLDWRGGMFTDDLNFIYFVGGILLVVGIAFLINYFVGRKMLAKEIEAEQNQMLRQA